MTSGPAGGVPEPPKEFATNDASIPRTVADAINELLAFTAVHEANGRSAAIASAYFNVDGWRLLSGELTKVGKVRLMLGAEPQRETTAIMLRPDTMSARKAAGEILDDALRSEAQRLADERNMLPFTPEAQSAVAEMIGWLRSGKVEVRRYTQRIPAWQGVPDRPSRPWGNRRVQQLHLTPDCIRTGS